MTNILLSSGQYGQTARSECSRLLVDARDYYRAFYAEAARAERSILLAGWQLDSQVELLRGEDVVGAQRPVRFLPFLEALSKERPDLQIYILAWDYSAVFAMEREWLQRALFAWTTPANVHFRFDSRHPAGASHHQKFAVIDGAWPSSVASMWRPRAGTPRAPLAQPAAFRGRLTAEALSRRDGSSWALLRSEPHDRPSWRVWRSTWRRSVSAAPSAVTAREPRSAPRSWHCIRAPFRTRSG